MKRYSVVGVVTGNKFLGEFLAESEEDAIEQALESDEACCCLCHQCDSECSEAEIESAIATEMEDKD